MKADENEILLSNKDLLRYIKELQEDVHLDLHSLREKSLMASSIWAKWLSYLYHEKENVAKIATAKSKLLALKMTLCKNNDSILRMKSEEKLAESDENILKLNVLSKRTHDNIDYIERALNILSNFGYLLRNVTEVLKLQANK